MVLQIYTLSSTIFISITLHSRSTPFKEFHDGMVDRLILSLKWLNRNCPNLPVKGYRTNEFPVPQKSEKVQRNQQRMQGNSSWHGTSQKPRRSNGFKLHSKKGSHRACNYVFFPFGQHMPACSLNLGFGFDHPNKHFVYPDKCIKNVEFARSILGKIHENPMIFCSSWTSPIEVPDQRDRDFNQGRSGCSSTCEKPAIALRFGKVESLDSSPGKRNNVYMKI